MLQWIFSTNIKNIGTLYFIFALFSIIVGLFLTFSQFLNVYNFSIVPSYQDSLKSFLVPIMIYSNAYDNKSIILSAHKGRAGIYMWMHKESGKFYIGSAVDLSKRLSKYYTLSELKRANNRICNALICHTHSAFSLSILDYIGPISHLPKGEARKLILSREQFYLDFLLPEYNILKTAGSSLGNSHSAETIKKISLALSGENHPMFGKAHSSEAKAKISEAKRGINNPNFNKSPSIETRALLSAARGTAIFQYGLDGTLLKSFTSAREAAKYFECSKGTILKYAKNGELFKNEWRLSLDN